MASIYEKKPFFVLQRWWDTKTVLPKVYKLQSNNPCNKHKAEIHNDDGLLGIEFTLDKTISKFIRTLKKLNLDYVTSFAEFGNVLLVYYQTDWKQVLHEHFPEPADPEVVKPAQDCALADNFLRVINLFLIRTLNKKNPRDCQYIYLVPDGDHGIHKELLMTPFYHLHCFEEMLRITKFLPEGDIPPPNATLQVEWFYMSFHCLDQAEYVRSGCKLSNKMLQTLVEYFESIFLARNSNGLIQRKYDEQLCSAAKRKLRHELEERYREKLKRLLESRESHYSQAWCRKRNSRSTCDGRPTHYGDCRRFKAHHSGYKDTCGDCKAPSEDLSSTSRAICMVLTASILTTSADRTQRIKHAQTTTTTTTTLKNAPTMCTTMMATALVTTISRLFLARVPHSVTLI
jgi:hypothetical protein